MKRDERGISMLEVTVTMALLMVISLIFYESYVGSLRAAQFLESRGDLMQFGQKTLNGLKSDISQGRYMFQNDATGASYVSRLQFPPGITPETGTRLPTVDANGTLVPDTGSQTRVGNALMLARQLTPLTLSVDVNGDATPDNVLADRYQFLYVFTARNTRRAFRPEGFYLDLVAGTGPVYADYFQLQGFSGTVRDAIGAALYAQDVRKAWNAGQPATNALYDISSGGTLSLDANPTIPLAAASLFPQFAGGRISGNMAYSVAMTRTPPLQAPDPVSQFAVAAARFPGGFEVLAVGPAGARKVHLRLCLLAQYGDKINSQVTSVTATTMQM